MEPPDLVGMPSLADGTTRFVPPGFLPTRGKGLLVFEELNRCEKYMRAPCLQLLTARTLNDYILPAGWLPLAAINPPNSEYDVHELDPALLSRFVQLHVVADREEWLVWAREAGLHKDVLGYVESDAKVFEDTNPRAWHYVSNAMQTAEKESSAKDTLETVIAGDIGCQPPWPSASGASSATSRTTLCPRPRT
jgi:MoxR-like ATPase